jgi:hypothetical protein
MRERVDYLGLRSRRAFAMRTLPSGEPGDAIRDARRELRRGVTRRDATHAFPRASSYDHGDRDRDRPVAGYVPYRATQLSCETVCVLPCFLNPPFTLRF